MTYPTDALTAVCKMLLDEYDMTPEQIAYERAYDPERMAARDEAVNRALIDAGRGHLVGR